MDTFLILKGEKTLEAKGIDNIFERYIISSCKHSPKSQSDPYINLHDQLEWEFQFIQITQLIGDFEKEEMDEGPRNIYIQELFWN